MKISLQTKGLLLPAISGILLTFSQPFFDVSFLAWVGLTPTLFHLKKETTRGGFLSGMVLGLFYFMGTQYWIYHSLYHYGGFPFLGSILLVFLLCLYESIYTGLFGMIVSHLSSGKMPIIFSAPFIWTGLEYLRGIALTGFPWSVLGYSQHGFISLIQISDITGVYGVSFLIVLINATIVELIYTFFPLKKDTPRKAFSNLSRVVLYKTAPALLLIIVALLYGQTNLSKFKDLQNTDTLKVSLIQGNIDQDVKWNPDYQEEVMRTYENLTVGITPEEPDLVVWPETAIPFFLNGNKELFERLVSLPVATGVPLLTGAMIIRDVGEDFFNVTNSAVLINPDGKIPFEYDKIHLVPFGEYVPLKKLFFFIEKLVSVVGEFLPGDSYDTGEVKSARFPALICFEVVFPDLVREFIRRGGNLIINITNDAWFGNTSGPYQHFYMGVFRAVENRRYLIRAANSGISGFIGPDGRVIKKTDLFERTTLTERVRTINTKSFYTRWGDIFSIFCMIFTVILLAFSVTRRSKR